MLIQGSAKTDRTQRLVKEYTNLLEQGISADKILVLVQNSFKKTFFTNNVKETLQIKHFENPQIHTFFGLAYNTIINIWPQIQQEITSGRNVVTPNLTGLEISQFFFRSAIREIGFSDYNSKINLIHQLFRRYSLIVNNALTDAEVTKKSEILGETFAKDAQKAIEIYKKKTLEYRTFDYIRQAGIFSRIYKTAGCFKNIEYLIIDDADEITRLEFEFIEFLKPRLKQIFIGYDRYGTSRLGFLNADINTVENLEKLFSEDKVINLDNTKESGLNIVHRDCTRRLEMLNKAAIQIAELIKSGVSPEDISIVTPIIDTTLKFTLLEVFKPLNIRINYFSGSEKLCETPLVKYTLTLLNLSLGREVDIYEVRAVLNGMLKIPVKYCLPVVTQYNQTGEIKALELGNPRYNEALNALVETIDSIKSAQMPLSEKIFSIYKNLVNPSFDELHQLEKLNFFIKQIQDFETVFFEQKNNPALQSAILTQTENSIISENPSYSPEIEEKSIVVATAQKIIDFSLKTKYQFWLDISSPLWVKEDFGTLYNSWVFQKSWDKKEFTYEENLELTTLKTRKQLRKLSLLAQENIFAYSSLFDSEGNENFGALEEYITTQKETPSEKINFNFTPREDQKPVLDYKSGKMAVSAVPGAGKTTILLALIIKLLSSGVKSDNIFVMTYMDSAAKNFKERIKKACPDLEKLPNISTIHGLALRILKENANYVKAGLSEDFEVCDDNLRQKILREIMVKMQLPQEDFDKYEKAVSSLKLSDVQKIPYVKNRELQTFIKFYNVYNNCLKTRNIIDYDDMLSYCVKILEENKDVANYYQNLCRYVIEDEAQDSSSIQQKLLNLLSQKHKNLIRCGDINQAITTTFTNADTEGFKSFVKTNKNISMNHSQRCCKDVYETANRLIDYSKNTEELKEAFFDIKMQGVDGKNPVVKNGLEAKTFDTYNEENVYILQQLRSIFAREPEASVAILVRNNYKIDEYSQFLGNYGYNVINRSDCLENQAVFALVFSLLKFIAHPWQNDTVLKTAQQLKQQRILKLSNEDLAFIKELKTPFILQSQDELSDSALSQFLWDLNYWLENTGLTTEEIVVKIGNYYYNTDVEKSNIYIIALLLKRMAQQYKTNDVLLERIEELSKKPVLSKFKFFSEDKEQTKTESSIHIMTYHKSKGDEFDYVFIPGLSEEILPFALNQIKIKPKERFIEAVKGLNLNYKKKDEKDLKIFVAQENLRLFYVAMTRAKKKLYVTCAGKYKKFAKIKDTKISVLFNEFFKESSGETNAK